MITLDTIKSALFSQDPYTRMDELVRTELGNGRTTSQITDTFRPLIDTVLEIPDLDKGAEEAFLSTLDALTGNCREDQCYQDPPNRTVPTKDEIAKLPRWARVAFAARCARRVLPLFTHDWPDAIHDHVKHVFRAVELAETASAHAVTSNSDEAVDSAKAAIAAARAAANAPKITRTNDAAAVAFAASHAAIVAGDPSKADAVYAASTYVLSDALAFSRRSDFDHLARLAEWQHWTDDTPVPPEMFGPLWPEGPPKGWPPITDVPARADLPIELFARERATEQMIEDDVVNLFNALNRYHIARSGVRLTLEQFRSLISALVPAEA